MLEPFDFNIPPPADLIISKTKWKYMVRNICRAKNILLLGPTGTAKTFSAEKAALALSRKFFKFNCGSSQDARALFVGNMYYSKEKGTYFNQSAFVRAIQTKNAVIVLDELTRSTHDGVNILIPTLDPTQRCLRLDEQESSEVINVADGVCFIATANIGSEYTATRVLDKAISRRFPVKIEMDVLSKQELEKLRNIRFPTMKPEKVNLCSILIKIYDDILTEYKKEDSELSAIISPANMVEIFELVEDNFTLVEICECAIYPEFSEDGLQGERTHVKMISEKYIGSSSFANPIKSKKNEF